MHSSCATPTSRHRGIYSLQSYITGLEGEPLTPRMVRAETRLQEDEVAAYQLEINETASGTGIQQHIGGYSISIP